MRSADVRELLRQQPFQPLRLYLTDGTTFEIRHPDEVIVGKSILMLALPPTASAEREGVISLVHIMWIEVTTPKT